MLLTDIKVNSRLTIWFLRIEILVGAVLADITPAVDRQFGEQFFIHSVFVVTYDL